MACSNAHGHSDARRGLRGFARREAVAPAPDTGAARNVLCPHALQAAARVPTRSADLRTKESSTSFNGLQRAATLTNAFKDTSHDFHSRQDKVDVAKDNQNGRVTIVKKLQKYSEILLGAGGDQQRGSFPLRGSSMQTS